MKLITLTLFTGFILMAGACSKRANFVTSTVVPAAQGTVKVKNDANNNNSITVSVKNLADPSRLPMPKSVYVVWMDTDNNGIQNLGQISNKRGILSRNLKAELKTSTPYRPRRIFITGEENSRVQYPGNYVILTTQSIR